MGRFWEVGSWIGPRSRFQRWVERRRWHSSLFMGVLFAIVWFLRNYFGLFGLGPRDLEGRLVPLLLWLLFAGALVAIARLGLDTWVCCAGDRK